MLDVATGDGNAAIECARRGASVVAIDLTPKQIALAKERCAAEGVEVDLRVGNTMALGVEDDSFDVVLSVLGVMFAPDPDVAIAGAGPGGASRRRGRSRVVDARRLVVSLATMCRGGGARCGGTFPDRRVGRRRDHRATPDGQWADRRDVETPFSWTFRSVDVAIDFLSSASPQHVTALAKAAEAGVANELRPVRRHRGRGERGDRRELSLPAPWLLAVAAPSRATYPRGTS